MYTRRLITLNITAEKKAELDVRIKSAQETLEEYEAKVNQDLLIDEKIRDRITEEGFADLDQDPPSQKNKKEHTNGTRH